jgi:hypothetical protein
VLSVRDGLLLGSDPGFVLIIRADLGVGGGVGFELVV